jgi:hypothetical protein
VPDPVCLALTMPTSVRRPGYSASRNSRNRCDRCGWRSLASVLASI